MEFIVEQNGGRLDKFLAEKLPRISRTKMQSFIRNGAVKINGHFVIKPGFNLRVRDRVILLEEKVVAPSTTEKFVVEPEPDIPLSIVYEDEDIAVINKPAGLLTHPTISQPKHTLANALVARYPQINQVGENPMRPGIVHRLDKDTSGLIIVAKNQTAFLAIKKQFLERQVTKKYLALVEGIPKEKEGVIELAIRPSQKNRLKKVAMVTKADDKRKSVRAAKTLYKVRQIFNNKDSLDKAKKNEFALLEVAPQTGRTHQIRVHLSAIGHPVVSDRLYGSRSRLSKRQFLHAYFLNFIAPNGQPLALEIDLPEDLKNVLETLGG